MRSVLAAVALVALAAGPAAALPADVEQGRTIFQQRCAACHTIGGGDRVGPDLAGVGGRRDHDWLERWIAAPERLIAAHDPLATQLLEKYRHMAMPNLGLSATEVDAVVTYLTAPPAGTPAAAPPAPMAATPPPGGDAVAGKALFTGARALTNGGPPCMACHSIAGIGVLGGGGLGPDLTMAAGKYGPSGLASVLATIPFPTMNPIFGRRPLTPAEQADLRVFVSAASVSGRAPGAIGRLSVLALAGAAVFFGLVQYHWRHRLRGVRSQLVEGARARMRAGAPATSRRA